MPQLYNHPQLKLGAILGSGSKDPRTIWLDQFVKINALSAPVSWDFDRARKPFQFRVWGNDQYANSEIAARCNALTRLERVETGSNLHLTDDDAINCYKTITGCALPGDSKDRGLSTLDNLKQWKKGWSLSRKYSIDAYGMINTNNHELIRLCSYLFHGMIVGANLPRIVQKQFKNGEIWDVDSGPNAEPGSWGSHVMFSKRYDANTISFITWGREIQVTNKWWDYYVEEAFCVIDSLNVWRKIKHALDIVALIKEMQSVGIAVES